MDSGPKQMLRIESDPVLPSSTPTGTKGSSDLDESLKSSGEQSTSGLESSSEFRSHSKTSLSKL